MTKERGREKGRERARAREQYIVSERGRGEGGREGAIWKEREQRE